MSGFAKENTGSNLFRHLVDAVIAGELDLYSQHFRPMAGQA